MATLSPLRMATLTRFALELTVMQMAALMRFAPEPTITQALKLTQVLMRNFTQVSTLTQVLTRNFTQVSTFSQGRQRNFTQVPTFSQVLTRNFSQVCTFSQSPLFGRLAPDVLLPVLNPFRFLRGPHRELPVSARFAPSESLGVSSITLLERDLRTEILRLELRAEGLISSTFSKLPRMENLVLSSLLDACP